MENDVPKLKYNESVENSFPIIFLDFVTDLKNVR